MTRFTVVWDVDVESQFINAWTTGNATTRTFLTDIANWVDANLADDPELLGYAWSEPNTYIATVPTQFASARVSVTYQVRAEDRQVRIVRLLIRGQQTDASS